MDSPSNGGDELFEKVIEVGVKATVLIVLLVWGFQIISPFVHVLVWAAILAIALFPLHEKLTAAVGQRNTLSATIIGFVGVVMILGPLVTLTMQSFDSTREVAAQWKAGSLEIAMPSEKVRTLPLVGEKIYAAWSEASTNLPEFVEHFKPQLKELGTKLLGMAASVGAGAFSFSASLIIAAVFMATAQSQKSFFDRLEGRITGGTSSDFVGISIATIRSVAQGILGIAVIQAVLAAIGFVVMDVPLSALWTLGVLLLAIAQIPALLILGPIAAWSFSVYDSTSATLFAIWCVLTALSDNVLKPMLLGRGLDIPMLVILVGAIGGMITTGIVGLFVGAVVLALIYRLFMQWMRPTREETRDSELRSDNAA